MSLLPSTLLNASSNEDQTLEIHSEILEPLAHSQTLARWEIPHKNIMDSDSVLIWNVNFPLQSAHENGDMVALPLKVAGLYDTIKRARLYVNGKIISELNEVGKYLTLKSNFMPHEVKTEVNDFFSYANNELDNTGQILGSGAHQQRTPNDKELGQKTKKANNFRVEASLKLHQLFSVLKDAQLDTNSINGKIMIEIDWNVSGVVNNAIYAGGGVVAGDKGLSVSEPRLILDFLTYNDEVLAQIKNTIFGDGPGINMPYREVALVRKNLTASAVQTNTDFAIGMTGRAVQKLFVAKVMDVANNDVNNLMGDCRSDLLAGQEWNIRVNDLMIYDRNVNNRAEEFNYVQQTGEAQFTCPPASFERRDSTIHAGYTTNDNVWGASEILENINSTTANVQAGVVNSATAPSVGSTYNKLGRGYAGAGVANLCKKGADIAETNVAEQRQGRQNYLSVNLAKYMNQETPLNAVRVGSTPIIFSLQRNGASDADTTAKSGTIFFFVEYLKMMNLKNGEVSVMDL